jgi:transcriptional regulator with XRE-family HTH domain
MLVKDQLQVRMDQLEMPVTELARRVGVSGQSVRHWLAGRSFPGKAKCNLIEEALSFKLDFSEGNTGQTETIDQKLTQTDLATRNAISQLPPDLQVTIGRLAAQFILALREATAARPRSGLDRPMGQANHGRPSASADPDPPGAAVRDKPVDPLEKLARSVS